MTLTTHIDKHKRNWKKLSISSSILYIPRHNNITIHCTTFQTQVIFWSEYFLGNFFERGKKLSLCICFGRSIMKHQLFKGRRLHSYENCKTKKKRASLDYLNILSQNWCHIFCSLSDGLRNNRYFILNKANLFEFIERRLLTKSCYIACAEMGRLQIFNYYFSLQRGGGCFFLWEV